MLHDSTQRLILKLCEMTDRGEIAWREPSGGGSETSLYETEGYAVEVKSEPPSLRILRADGREVERADAAELQSSPWPLGGGTFATHVKAMAVRAHRVARGAEAAIASILSALAAPPRNIAAASTEAAGVQPGETKAATSLAAQAIPDAEPARVDQVAAAAMTLTQPPIDSERAAAAAGSQLVARIGPSFGAIGSFARTPQAASHVGLQAAKATPASADAYKPWL